MDNLRQIKIQDSEDSTKTASVDNLGNLSVKTEDAEINQALLVQAKLTNMYLSEIANIKFTEQDIDT